MLATVYDTMYTMYTKCINTDEQDLLFSVTNIYVLKIMSNLQPKFEGTFFSVKLTKLNGCVQSVWYVRLFHLIIEIFDKTIWRCFQDSLHFDQNGSSLGNTKCSGNVLTMMLKHPQKPSHYVTEDEPLWKVITWLTTVKEGILTNIIQNAKDKCDHETCYFSWSGLDLQMNLSVPDRITRPERHNNHIFIVTPKSTLCRSIQTRKKIQLQTHVRVTK